MKLILTRDVPNLGTSGDLINVAEGYGRNYLLPRKLAVAADKGALKGLENRRKMLDMRGEHVLAGAQGVAERLKDATVRITGKAGQGTKLYGSVTSQEIADALEEQQSIKVDKRKIHITDPIKNLGEYDVPVKLHHDVPASIHVEVVGEEEVAVED